MKLILLASMLAFVVGCSTIEIQKTVLEPSQVKKVVLAGGPRGVFDPSFEVDPETHKVWMTYSSVEKPSEKSQDTVSTRLASSSDQGRTWVSSGTLNPVLPVKTEKFPSASWNSEVSTIVYEPGAPRERRWKMMWHHYLTRHDSGPFVEPRKFEHGWIALKEAASPEKLAEAPETKLFVTKAYKDLSNTLHGLTDSPVGGPGVINFSTDLSDDLNSCIVLSEPGLMSTSDALYLSISCYRIALGFPLFKIKASIVLLKCDSPCRATEKGSWKYVNTLLTSDQAEKFGFNKFSAPSLVQRGDQFFMWVSPVSNKPFDDSYNGCILYQFADLKTGTLRQKDNLPEPLSYIQTREGTFNGACDEEPSLANNKLMMGQVFMKSPEMFQLFNVPLQ